MNRINRALKKLILSHCFFLFARTSMRIFMGVFLWNITGNLLYIALFEIPMLLMHGTTFHVAGRLVKKGHVYLLRNLGLLGTLVMMTTIALLGNNTIAYLIPVAMLYGISNGMYWIAHHTLTFDLTHTKNRGNYVGHEQGAKRAISLVAPIVGGYLITANLWGFGYGTLFLFAGLMVLISYITGKFHVPEKRPDITFHIKETHKHITNNSDMKKVMLAVGLTNFGRIGAMETLLPIFLLTVLGTELHVGGWLSLFAIFSVIASILAGKYIQYTKYKKLSLGSGISVATILSMLIVFPGFITYALFGVVNELTKSLSTIPRRTYYQNLLHTLKDHTQHRIEYIVIREWYVSIFRILGYVPLLFAASLSSWILTMLLASMAIALFVEPLLIRSLQMDLSKSAA